MRDETGDFLARHPLGVDAVQQHPVAAAEKLVALRFGMRQIQHPARAEHHVVIELFGQLVPELQ